MNYLLIACLLCFSINGFAQFSENDSVHFAYRISATGSFNEGNLNRFVSANSLELSFLTKNKKSGMKSLTSYTLGTVNHKTTESDVLTRNLFFYKTSAAFYPIALVWIENNIRRKFDLLLQSGAGMAYVPVRNKMNYFNLSGFITVETKHFEGSVYNHSIYDGTETIETTRFTIRVHGIHRIKASGVKFNYEFYYQSSLKWVANYRFHGDASFDIPVSKHFSIRSALNYNHESIVLKYLKAKDVSISWGISFFNF